MSLLIIVALFLLALLGVPLFLVLAGGALVAFAREGISSSAVITEMGRLATSPVLISIPLFTFAGYLFAESRAAERVVGRMVIPAGAFQRSGDLLRARKRHEEGEKQRNSDEHAGTGNDYTPAPRRPPDEDDHRNKETRNAPCA